MKAKTPTLKQRFLDAIVQGKLGTVEDEGVVFTLQEFKDCFSDIKSHYINSFLPGATLEIGQHTMQHTRYLFRLKTGLYRVHPDAIQAHIEQMADINAIEAADKPSGED